MSTEQQVRRNIILAGLVDEKLGKRITEIETVALTSITEQVVLQANNEEMEALTEYAEQVISMGSHDVPKYMDAIDFLVYSAKYN